MCRIVLVCENSKVMTTTVQNKALANWDKAGRYVKQGGTYYASGGGERKVVIIIGGISFGEGCLHFCFSLIS